MPDVADLRLKVLQLKHDHILAGHVGQNKTLEAVQRDYFWPNLHPRILQFMYYLQKV